MKYQTIFLLILCILIFEGPDPQISAEDVEGDWIISGSTRIVGGFYNLTGDLIINTNEFVLFKDVFINTTGQIRIDGDNNLFENVTIHSFRKITQNSLGPVREFMQVTSNNNTFTESSFYYSFGSGIEFQDGATDNIIKYCQFGGDTDYTTAIWGDWDAYNLTILGNHFKEINSYTQRISLNGGNDHLIENNTGYIYAHLQFIENLIVRSNEIPYGQIWVQYSDNVIIERNLLTGRLYFYQGILISDSENVIIRDNHIEGSDKGITLTNELYNVDVHDNYFEGSKSSMEYQSSSYAGVFMNNTNFRNNVYVGSITGAIPMVSFNKWDTPVTNGTIYGISAPLTAIYSPSYEISLLVDGIDHPATEVIIFGELGVHEILFTITNEFNTTMSSGIIVIVDDRVEIDPHASTETTEDNLSGVSEENETSYPILSLMLLLLIPNRRKKYSSSI